MIPLVRLCALSLLFAASAPLPSQSGTPGCIPFVTDPSRMTLVQKVQLSGGDRMAAVVDLRRAGSRNLGEFLSEGGSLVVVDAQGGTLGIANRDTLDSVALDSKVSVLEMSSTALDQVNPLALPPQPANQSDIKLGEIPDSPVPSPQPGLPDGLDLELIKRLKTNPYGLEIGGFDGTVAPSIAIGPFNGTPAVPGQSTLPIQPASAKDRALAATVAIYFRDKAEPGKIESCNGVQIGPGLILTNLHCATRRHTGHVVHFGSLHIQPDNLLPGTPVSGSVRCPATIVSPDPGQGQRLDFALLRVSGTVPAPYSSAIMSLDDGTGIGVPGNGGQAQDDLSATQVQYWLAGATGGASVQYQKYLMQPPNCAIKRTDGLAPKDSYYCNPKNIEPSDGIDHRGVGHVCDAERGSSGSPLFDPAFGKVLALHRGGGRYFLAQNCAVPASAIRGELQAWGQL